ncbi:MAG: hypothetical protein GYA24_08800 [Candidatus Lokiarchaeota archaeon]|nr:hypothetical protein [Candidatus Lokiarchaeota archaeon]
MHLNAHIAFSTAVTLLMTTIGPVRASWLEIVACILAGVVIDGDFIFLHFSRHKNHRMLLTHSIVLPLAFILASIALMFLARGTSLAWTAWTCAINALVHDAVDSIDWGLNFFANGKIVGKRILLGGASPEAYYAEARKTTPIYAAFYRAYYGHKAMRALEVVALVTMCAALAVSWPGAGQDHWWTILAYAGLLGFHAMEWRRCKAATRPARPRAAS